MMKEKLYDPAGNNQQAPEKGMASANSFTAEETDTHNGGLPKNFERNEERGQTDDTVPFDEQK